MPLSAAVRFLFCGFYHIPGLEPDPLPILGLLRLLRPVCHCGGCSPGILPLFGAWFSVIVVILVMLLNNANVRYILVQTEDRDVHLNECAL